MVYLQEIFESFVSDLRFSSRQLAEVVLQFLLDLGMRGTVYHYQARG